MIFLSSRLGRNSRRNFHLDGIEKIRLLTFDSFSGLNTRGGGLMLIEFQRVQHLFSNMAQGYWSSVSFVEAFLMHPVIVGCRTRCIQIVFVLPGFGFASLCEGNGI